MLFNSFIFLFAFLPVTYVVFWALRSTQARYVWLTLTGYVFYGYWNPRFCLLMAFSTLVSYTAGLGLLPLDRSAAPKVVPGRADRHRPRRCSGSSSMPTSRPPRPAAYSHVLGTDVTIPHLNIILPIGISFYTFHTITLHRGQLSRGHQADPQSVRVRRRTCRCSRNSSPARSCASARSRKTSRTSDTTDRHALACAAAYRSSSSAWSRK